MLERLFKADMFLYERRKQFCLRNGTGRNELLFSLTARAIQKQLALVQRLLQQSSAAVTQRYIGIEPQRIEKAIEGHAELILVALMELPAFPAAVRQVKRKTDMK